MVRIVRLSLEEGVLLPDDVTEIEWPEAARRRRREQAPHGTPVTDPPPKRRRGRPRKHPPPTDWRPTANPTPEHPIPQSPPDAEQGLD